MTPNDRTAYILTCLCHAAAMYPDGARQFLAEHDADVLRGAADSIDRTPSISAAVHATAELRRLADAGPSETDPAEAAQPGGPFERLTVLLTPASSAALNRCAQTTGDTRTDTINRAIQTYALMAGEVADGSRVLVQRDGQPSAETTEDGGQ